MDLSSYLQTIERANEQLSVARAALDAAESRGLRYPALSQKVAALERVRAAFRHVHNQLLKKAVRYGHVDFVERMLQAGADPSGRDDDGTPLIELATRNGRHDIAQMLVERQKEAPLPGYEG